MEVGKFTSVNPNMSATRTYQDFSQFIGTKPARFGIVARMFPENTIEYITEALGNVFYKDYKKSKVQSINSMSFEWEIETSEIKRLAIVDTPVGNGYNGSEITMAFGEHYYNMNDTFQVDDARQQFFVTSGPIRKADDYWEYQVRIVDASYDTLLDDAVTRGATTRWIGNAFPELSEFGFIKYQSNFSKFRNYLTTIRVDDSASSVFQIQEDTFIKLGNGEGSNAQDKETIYRLDSLKSNLMRNFVEASNNMMLLSHTNVDSNGKPTLYDRQNRPIIIGEGLIPQIERYASKYGYNKFSLEVFNTMIDTLTEKAANSVDNHYTIFVNDILWRQFNQSCGKFLADHKTDGAHLWSRKANGGTGGYIKVGTSYNEYEWAGNFITIRVERALSREYPNKGYGVAIDLTADATKNMPAVSMFTLRGGECIQNDIKGVGGLDGLSSGEVSSNVAGSKYVIHGYKGCAVFNPFRSYILREL